MYKRLISEQMKDLELEFTKMVREYRSTIYSVCYFFSDNPTEVDDLFQEVLVNLWKGFPDFRNESSLKTWIWRISLNTCCSIQKRERRNVPTVPLLIDKDLFSESEQAGRQVKMLYDRINKLEVFDRAIILLWLESMSYDEIGAIVGISTSAVTSRLFRIKEQLKSMNN
jgi:RNA polymerase sigma-70 factor (ECF subfamily)